MLDFGSRMNDPAAERDDDDLFSAARNVPSEPAGSESPEVAAAEPESPEVPVAAASEPENVFGPAASSEPAGKSLRQLLNFHHRRKDDSRDEADLRETAELLVAARESAGLALADVERETQIRLRYLEALEKGELSNLPQPVYVLAYLRKLSALYHISAEDEEVLVRPWRTLRREVPENLPGTMISTDEDGESGGMRRRAEFYLLAAMAILVIGLVTFLVVLTVSYFNRNKVVSRFDHSELLELQPRPQLTIPEQPPVSGRR